MVATGVYWPWWAYLIYVVILAKSWLNACMNPAMRGVAKSLSRLETVQDFFLPVGHETTYLWKIIIFQYITSSSDLPKLSTTSSKNTNSDFSVENQWNLFDFFPLTNMSLEDQFIFLRFLEDLIFKILYFLKMCPIFGGSLDDFGRSENDML